MEGAIPTQAGLLNPGVHGRAPRTDGFAVERSAPTSTDILFAVRAVWRHLDRTPLEFSPELSRRTGRTVFLKLENCSPIRSFKARGALVALTRMTPAQRAAGVVTASTGNHGQGVTFAATRFDAPSTVVVPKGAEPAKTKQIAHLGAELVTAGKNLTEAQEAAIELANERGQTYIEDGEEPALMAGAATVAWEMLEQEPGLDTIIVPVGGGNLIAASLIATSLLRPDVDVVGVQSAAALGATLSWLAGDLRSSECTTFAGGLAAERPGRLALSVMDRLLRAMAVVTEDDLRAGILAFYEATAFAIEGAAAAPLAALTRFPEDIPGERVGLIASGGWLSPADLCLSLQRRAGERNAPA